MNHKQLNRNFSKIDDGTFFSQFKRQTAKEPSFKDVMNVQLSDSWRQALAAKYAYKWLAKVRHIRVASKDRK
jgi:hypothetical protein